MAPGNFLSFLRGVLNYLDSGMQNVAEWGSTKTLDLVTYFLLRSYIVCRNMKVKKDEIADYPMKRCTMLSTSISQTSQVF